MIASIKQFFHLLLTANMEYFWIGVCMVSAIIVFLGIVKHFTFDKIKNEVVRDITLSLASIAICFGGTAVMLWVKSISFDYYWVVSCVISATTIIAYWAYAHLGFKPLIHWIGSKTLAKVFGVVTTAKDVEELKAHLEALPTEMKKAAQKAKKNKVDKELENL